MKIFLAKLSIYKQWILVISLLSLCLVGILISLFTIGLSFQDDDDEREEKDARKRRESFAKIVKYYVYKDGQPALFLDAKELMTDEIQKVSMFSSPIGVAYTKSMTPINYKAKRGSYDMPRQLITFKDDVVVDTKNSEMRAKEMSYDMPKDRVTCVGNVETSTYSEQTGDNILVKAYKVLSWPQSGITKYYSNVNGHIARKRQYEESLRFRSNRMKLDLNTSKVDLTGDVKIRKQNLKADSHRGEIFLENYNKKLKYFVLYDDVQIKEEIQIDQNPVIYRKAFAEKLEGIMSEDIYVLTGFPKVYQGKDAIKGNKIILRENNEVVEIDDVSTNFILE